MHLHGHNFYVLHEGPGTWDGTIVRPSNPHRRDVHLVRGNGHLVIQFDGAPGNRPLPLFIFFLFLFISHLSVRPPLANKAKTQPK